MIGVGALSLGLVLAWLYLFRSSRYGKSTEPLVRPSRLPRVLAGQRLLEGEAVEVRAQGVAGGAVADEEHPSAVPPQPEVGQDRPLHHLHHLVGHAGDRVHHLLDGPIVGTGDRHRAATTRARA